VFLCFVFPEWILCICCVCTNRKASLALLRKMIHYITPVLLDEICSQEGAGVKFGSQLVEVLSVVLDNEVNFMFLNSAVSHVPLRFHSLVLASINYIPVLCSTNVCSLFSRFLLTVFLIVNTVHFCRRTMIVII